MEIVESKERILENYKRIKSTNERLREKNVCLQMETTRLNDQLSDQSEDFLLTKEKNYIIKKKLQSKQDSLTMIYCLYFITLIMFIYFKIKS